MAVLPVVEIPDPRLRLVSASVASVGDDTRRLIADMTETMYAAKGIGLAAIQVGVPLRVVVIDLQEDGEDGEPVRDPHAYVNPQVVAASDEVGAYNEGCLSIPEQYAEVSRPVRCRVRWLDGDGGTHEEEMDGLLATCMQHEIDHCDGILFIDHISRLKREMLLKKLNKARRAV